MVGARHFRGAPRARRLRRIRRTPGIPRLRPGDRGGRHLLRRGRKPRADERRNVWLHRGRPGVLFAFARHGLLPRALGRVHPKTSTPPVAILACAALAAVLALTGSFVELAVLSTPRVCGIVHRCLRCGVVARTPQRRARGCAAQFPLAPSGDGAGRGHHAVAHRRGLACRNHRPFGLGRRQCSCASAAEPDCRAERNLSASDSVSSHRL